MSKLRMRADDLRVDSFPTAGMAADKGTVRGHGDDCTWVDSCFCHTAYAVCGTGHATIYSCTYTNDERCPGDTVVEPCERTVVDCPDTSYQVCGTPPITIVC
jgi:hypothetical protein